MFREGVKQLLFMLFVTDYLSPQSLSFQAIKLEIGQSQLPRQVEWLYCGIKQVRFAVIAPSFLI
jgi:hypothetical protein